MNKRSKLWALLGALILTLGVAGIALANSLSVDHPNQVNTPLGDLVSEEGVAVDCTDFDELEIEVGEGQVGLHFILPPQQSADSGQITVTVDGTVYGPIDNTEHGNSEAMHFYVVIDGDEDSEISEAVTDVTSTGKLTLSHICWGPPEETTEPSFEESQEGETDAPSDEPTDEPSFEESQEGETDAPTEPTTDAINGKGSSAPADGAWLLVVALGVLLGSIVVLTPARAKSRR